jgi:hypothetical protein
MLMLMAEASLLKLENVQDDHDEPEGQFTKVNNRRALRARMSKICFHTVSSDAGRLSENSQ